MGCQAAHLYPYHGLDPLWLFLSVTEQTSWLPGSQVPWTHHHPPTHPLYTTLVILQVLKNSQKPLKNQLNQLFQLAANSVHVMLDIRLVFFWCKSGMATIKSTAVSQIQILEIQNVTIRLIFLNPVTIIMI